MGRDMGHDLGLFFLHYYYVYLHEKNQFWPISSLEMIGQSERLRINPKEVLGGVFQVREIQYISKRGRPCNQEPSYSFTQCLKNYIRSVARCQLWIWKDDQEHPPCLTIDDFQVYKGEMDWILKAKPSDIIAKTRCFPKCKIREFVFTTTSKSKVSEGAAWHGEFQLGVKLSSYEDYEEYFVFGFQDFITSLGGFLGLFLGWSLLEIIDWLQGIVGSVTQSLSIPF